MLVVIKLQVPRGRPAIAHPAASRCGAPTHAHGLFFEVFRHPGGIGFRQRLREGEERLRRVVGVAADLVKEGVDLSGAHAVAPCPLLERLGPVRPDKRRLGHIRVDCGMCLRLAEHASDEPASHSPERRPDDGHD